MPAGAPLGPERSKTRDRYWRAPRLRARERKEIVMHSIIYLIGLVVVIAFILSLFGLT
jgi:hypothetical protein